MPSGVKIRSRKKRSKLSPETTSSSREHIEAHGSAVHPSRTRLKLERCCGEGRNEMSECFGPVLRNSPLADDARRMREQIANRNLARRRNRLSVVGRLHLQILERGNELRHRIAQPQSSVF